MKIVRLCAALWLASLLALPSAMASPVYEPIAGLVAGPESSGEARLYQHTDGNIYGTADGGNYFDGVIYRLKPATAELDVLTHFSGTVLPTYGADVRGELTSDGAGFLWGTSSDGGTAGDGTVFKYNLATGAFTTVLTFVDSIPAQRGYHPRSGLTNDGAGFLWGTTFQGGNHGWGTIFKINIATGAMTVLVDFTGATGSFQGSLCESGLVSDGNGFFWGSCQQGGAGNYGSVFKINRTTGAFTSMVAFTGTAGAAPGEDPAGSLVMDGKGFLWGVTSGGGATGYGTVYKVNASTGAFTSIANFTNLTGAVKGRVPEDALVYDGLGFVWGTTTVGGTANLGTIFKINVETGAFTTATEFTGTTGAFKGSQPRTGLMNDGQGFLWGTTYYGGTPDLGTIFKIAANSSVFTTVFEFNRGSSSGSNVVRPAGSMAADPAGDLWGTSEAGGANNFGAIFKVNSKTRAVTTMTSFTGNGIGNTGTTSYSGLVSDGRGFFWGSTYTGSNNNRGTIFKVQGTTGVFVNIIPLTGTTAFPYGGQSYAGLVSDGGDFMWGTTSNGGSGTNGGTVYKVNKLTTAFSTVVSFTGLGATKGSVPRCVLASDGNGFLWGTTSQGGATLTNGTIFKVDIATGAFTSVLDFTGNSGAALGRTPAGPMVSDGNGFMWGTTASGGANNAGTVYKISTATNALTTVYQFASGGGAGLGANPFGGLTKDAQGNFWGTAFSGGAGNFGTIFKVTPAGVFTNIFDFTGVSGAVPGDEPGYGALVRTPDGHMVGSTRAGGVTPEGRVAGRGQIFRLHFGPTLVTQATVGSSGSATLKGTVNPNGTASQVGFEYGTSPNLDDAQEVTSGTSAAGNTPVSFSKVVTGLIPGTTYYFRTTGASAENPITQRGLILSFTTTANTPPAVSLTGPAAYVFEAAETYQDPGATVTDAEEELTAQIIGNSVVPNVPGTYSITWGITDSWGLSASITRSVQIVDTTAPAIADRPDVIAEAAAPTGAVVSFAPASVTDAVGVASVAYTQASGTLFPLGTTTVTVTAKDGSNNVGTGTFNVVVRDTTKPQLLLPPAQIVEAQGPTGARVAFAPLASDLADAAPVVQSTPASGSTFPLGTTTVNVSARDAAGNVSTGNFTVTVRDTTKPSLTGSFTPLAIATGADGTVALPGYLPQASAGDAVGVASIVQSPVAGSLHQVGTTAVTITATDAAGNAATLKFDVAVTDGTPPALAAPADGFAPLTLLAGANGTAPLPDFAAQAIRSDNVAVTSVTQEPQAGVEFPPGTVPVIVTAQDAAGNQRTVQFEVTVIDRTLPVISAPEANFAPLVLATGEDGTVPLPDYTSQAETADNASIAGITQLPAPGSAQVAGPASVTLTVADPSGNTSELRFEVTVEDGTQPAIAAPVDGFTPLTLTAEADGTAPLPDFTGQAVTSDNVGVTAVTQSPAPGTARPFGKTEVTLTATDAAGNAHSTTFDVQVLLARQLTGTIAVSGGPVPGAGLDPRIPAGAVFTKFGLPAVDDQRGIAFAAEWKSGATKGAGIFAGQPAALVAAAGEAAPGVEGAQFKAFQDPVLAPSGALAFSATLSGAGLTAAKDQAVWLSTETGLVLVLREGTDFKTLAGLSLRDGELLASATLPLVPGEVTKANDTVLLRATPAGYSVLLQEGQWLSFDERFPASPVKTMSLLVPGEGSPAQGRTQADGSSIARVTLQDQRTGILQIAADGTRTLRLQSGEHAPIASASWTALGLPALAPGGSAAVLKAGLFAPAIPGQPRTLSTKNDTALVFTAGPASSPVIFAREGDLAPGAFGAAYATFTDPLVNDDGQIAFAATLAAQGINAKNKSGVWWGPPGHPVLLARFGEFAPDGDGAPTGAKWSKFISLALPGGAGTGPILLASVTGQGVTARTNQGLWAVDSTGKLRQLLRTGDLVNGQPILRLNALGGATGSLGATRGFNARGSVIVRVLLPKGQSGLLQIEIPASGDYPNSQE